MNTATIIGRAGQDAEIKYFESGKSPFFPLVIV